MSHLFTIDQTMAAPVERVYAAVTGFDAWSEWMPNLVRLERLNDLPFGPGFEWRETRKVFGREGTEIFTVEALDPGHALKTRCDGRRGSMGRGEFRFSHTLTPKNGLTLVSLQCEIDGLGWFGDWTFRLMGGMFKRAIAGDVSALRRYVESGKPAANAT
jgi:uncharacterized protein YndB with AHSA1/START domain